MFTNVLFYALTVLTAEDTTQSVLVPTPATQEAKPAVVAAAPVATPVVAPVTVVAAPAPRFVCENGKCRRVTHVEEQVYETHRHRIFGGHVTRNGTRTVYKTSRR